MSFDAPSRGAPRLLVSILLLAACGDAAPAAMTDLGFMDAGPAEPTRRLDPVSTNPLVLEGGEVAELAFSYRDANGRPLRGERVALSFSGQAHDSTLDGPDAITDADGVARRSLRAGATPTTFRVRADAPGAESAFLDVSVSDAGFGDLEVTLAYAGEKVLTLQRVTLYAEGSCASPAELDAMGDRVRALGPDGGTLRFPGLPAEITWVAVARGFGPGGAVLAEACADGIEITNDEVRTLALTLTDTPVDAAGSYDADLALTELPASEVAARFIERLSDRARDAGDTLWLVDAAILELSSRGESEAAAALSATRELDAATFEEELAPGPVGHVEALGAGLEAALAELVVSGALRVDAIEDSLAISSVRAGGRRLDLEANATLDVRSAAESAGVDVDLALSLPLGAVAAAWLGQGRGDLAALEASLEATLACEDPVPPSIGPVCGRDCWAAACGSVAEALAREAASVFGELDGRFGAADLAGTLAPRDTGGDLRIDDLEGPLLGTYGRTSEAAPAAATLRARRAALTR
ncbi:MAG: Ig-like domain-containing protein [Myxococcota bacterium]